MQTASPLAAGSRNRRFRIAVVTASVGMAIVGSVLLATRDSAKTTTVGISSTLRVPGHPGSVVAGTDALWVALVDVKRPIRDRPLVRIEIATGTRSQPVNLGGQASDLAHVGNKLIASVQRVGSDGSGPTWLTVLDWRSGIVLLHRELDEPVDGIVSSGNELWVLETRPGTLLRLDPGTLAPAAAPLALASGRTLGLASGAGYLWVTAADAGEVLRIDPATLAITVTLIDVQTGKKIGSSIRIAPPSKGATAPTVTPAGQSVWVSSFASNTLTRINSTAAGETAPPTALLAGGPVKVRITGNNDNGGVLNGVVAGHGNFTASGAITDEGTVTAYRTFNDPLITFRFVTVGKNGTITFVVNIHYGTSRWTIASATKAYKGLHGTGTEQESTDYTISTLTGTVSR